MLGRLFFIVLTTGQMHTCFPALQFTQSCHLPSIYRSVPNYPPAHAPPTSFLSPTTQPSCTKGMQLAQPSHAENGIFPKHHAEKIMHLSSNPLDPHRSRRCRDRPCWGQSSICHVLCSSCTLRVRFETAVITLLWKTGTSTAEAMSWIDHIPRRAFCKVFAAG